MNMDCKRELNKEWLGKVWLDIGSLDIVGLDIDLLDIVVFDIVAYCTDWPLDGMGQHMDYDKVALGKYFLVVH